MRFAFIYNRNTFQQENLLLAKDSSARKSCWIRSDQVIRNCPPFVRYTSRVSDCASVYYARLCELLELTTWNSEHHLKAELENGIASMASSDLDDQASSYVFQALSSIAHQPHDFFTSEACPEWVRAILRLPIFPIRTSDGQCTLQALGPDIFVPDSEDLKDNFQGNRKLLDFGENPIRNILSVLRCSEVALKYTSDYNEPSAMEVEIPEPATEPEMSSKEADDIMQFINTWTQSSTETFSLPAKDDALVSSPDSIPPSLKLMTDDDDKVEIIQSNIRSGFAGEYFVTTFAKFLIVDISETGRGASRVFDGKLD
jgi:hypothetical protein